jgi:hypothetical protein
MYSKNRYPDALMDRPGEAVDQLLASRLRRSSRPWSCHGHRPRIPPKARARLTLACCQTQPRCIAFSVRVVEQTGSSTAVIERHAQGIENQVGPVVRHGPPPIFREKVSSTNKR